MHADDVIMHASCMERSQNMSKYQKSRCICLAWDGPINILDIPETFDWIFLLPVYASASCHESCAWHGRRIYRDSPYGCMPCTVEHVCTALSRYSWWQLASVEHFVNTSCGVGYHPGWLGPNAQVTLVTAQTVLVSAMPVALFKTYWSSRCDILMQQCGHTQICGTQEITCVPLIMMK